MHTNLFGSKRTKEPTWEDLLDRESKEKDIRRDRRQNVIPMGSKKNSDIQKDQGKNKKIIDLQKQFEELKSKIRHVETKNEKMLSQVRVYHPEDEPIQDRTSPQARNVSRGRMTKQSLNKYTKNPERSLNLNSHSYNITSQIITPNEASRKNKADLKAVVDAALGLKKKQETFQRLILSKLRDLSQRIIQTQQLTKLCTDFQILKDNSSIQQKESTQLFTMKSKQLELIISQLQRDKKKLKSETQQLQSQIEDQRTKFQSQKQSYYQQIQDIRSKATKKMTQSQTKYEKMVLKYNDQMEQLKRHYSNKSLDSSRSQYDYTTKSQDIQLIQLQNYHLTETITQLRSQLEHQKSKSLNLLTEKSKAQFQLQKIQLSHSFDDTTQQLVSYKTEASSLQAQLRSLKKQKQQYQTQISNLTRQNKQYLLKMSKKDELRIEIQQTYKSKLKQQNKHLNTIRQDKRKIEMEAMQLKSFNKSLLGEKEKFAGEVVKEVTRMVEMENDTVIRTILDNYGNSTYVLVLEVLRIIIQRKTTEDEFRRKLVQRGIVKQADYEQGAKIQFFAIQHLWDTNHKLQKTVGQKQTKLLEKQQQWKGERDILQSSISKLKRTIDQHRKSHQQDNKTRFQSQPQKQQQASKFNQMKTFILKSQSQKKQLQNRIKILQIQQSNLNQTKQIIQKKKEKLQLQKQQTKSSFQSQLSLKDQKIKKLENDLRQNKQQYAKKKTQLTMENKRLQYSYSQLQIKIQRLNGDIEQKQIILAQKEDDLKRRKDESSNIQTDFKEVGKKLSISQNQMKLQEQELRQKITECLNLSSINTQLTTKLKATQQQFKEMQTQLIKQKTRTQQQHKSTQGTLFLIKQNQAFTQKKLEQKTKQLQKVKQSLQQSLNSIKQLQQSKSLISLQSQQTKTNTLSLQSKIKQLIEQIQQKDERIKAAVDDQNIYSYNLQELKQFNDKKANKLQKKIKQLENDNQGLKNDNEKLKKSLVQSKNIDNQNEQIRVKQLNDKQNKLEQHQKSLKQLSSKLQIKEKELVNKQQQIEQKQNQINEKQKTLLYQTTKLESETAKINQLKNQVKQKQQQLDSQILQIEQKSKQLQKYPTIEIQSKNLNLVDPKQEEDIANKQAIPFKQDIKKEFGLEDYDVSDNFEIGEVEAQNTNSPNAVVIEFFLRIKNEIEKIVHGQQISVEIFEVIPVEIENQFQDLLKLISDKVHDNQLSFIFIDQFNADTILGDSIMQQFPELNKQMVHLKRRVSQQQKIIADLTSQKGHHQHTINQMTQQMQQIQQQNQARFINQLSILKQELKQVKLKCDTLQICIAATKKTLFNILQILVSQQMGLQEDLAQALNYYNDVTKASDKDKKMLAGYFDRYAIKTK